MTTIPDNLLDEYPFTPRRFEHHGVGLNYVDEGQGSAVLCFHGNPTWSFYYRNVIKALKTRHRVLALDNVGCGLSDKPQDGYTYRLQDRIDDAVAWVESLDIESFDIIVHDWGGAIGMGVAERLPEKVKRIVILNTSAFFLDNLPKRIALCRIPLIGEWIVRGFNGFAGPATHMAVTKPLSKKLKQGFLLPYDNWANRIATHRFVKDIPMKPSHPSWDTLAKVEAGLDKLRDRPMLIAWGMKDFCFDESFLKEWINRFPEAKVMRCEKADHYVLEDAADEVIPAIYEFLT